VCAVQRWGFAKIDRLMAMFKALALMVMNPHADGIGDGIIIPEGA